MPVITKGKFSGTTMYARRVELGLTLEQVAERVRRSVSTLWAWEAGSTQPRANIIRALSEALDVKPVYFFNGKDK